MITVDCTCGGQFQILNEQIAHRVHCPFCGANAAEVLAVSAAPPATEETGFKIPCVNHPDQLATQNCMNCGKPLCMDCVKTNGYYCSDDCRATVAAAEPDAVTEGAEERAAIAEQVEHSMVKLGRILKISAVIAAIAVGGWIALLVVQKLLAPKGQVTARAAISSGTASFKAQLAAPDTVLVQANSSLSLVELPTQKTLWSLDLTTLEEKMTPRKSPVTGEDIIMPEDYRDALQLLERKGDTVFVRSTRQLIALNLGDGRPRWKLFEPDHYIGTVLVHDRGVWCSRGTQYVNLSLADGTRTCTVSNQSYAQPFCIGDRVVLLSYQPKRPAKIDHDEDRELTAGAHAQFDVRAILAEAQGKPAAKQVPTIEYTLQFVSLTDGHSLGQTAMQSPDFPRFESIGGQLYAVAGQQVAMFGEAPQPVWQATLPGSVQHLTGGGGLVVAATDQGIVALDATTGQRKWTRTDIGSENVAVSPAGDVYATIELAKERVHDGEAEKYRIAEIDRGGMGTPRPPYVVLLRLDPHTGKTLWGVRNIGRNVLFAGEKLYVVDSLEQTSLLANQIFVGGHSIQCLAARSGKELWSYVKTGDLYHHELDGTKVFIVIADDHPASPTHPSLSYDLQLVGAK